MGNETSKSLGVLLEINFGNPCGAALSTEDRAWSVIDSIVGSSECAHFVLMGETDMSQDSHSDGYHMLIKNISSAFPKATVFYYGKQHILRYFLLKNYGQILQQKIIKIFC